MVYAIKPSANLPTSKNTIRKDTNTARNAKPITEPKPYSVPAVGPS